MTKQKIITKKQIIFEPEKYVAYMGDYIIVSDEDYAHFTHSDECLYKTAHKDFTKYDEEIISNDLFVQTFYKMSNNKKKDIDYEALIERINDATQKAIVIGGCGRSGTTLLLSILSSHPRIEIFEETFSFYPRPMRLHKLCNQIEKTQGVWCEKTPKNIHEFKAIKKLFKNKVKLVHVVRDGRDVVTSRHPSNPNSYWVPIERWVDDVSKGLKVKDAYIIKYEDITKDTQNALRKLFTFLDIPFDDKILNPEFYGLNSSDAWFGKGKSINTQRIDKWKKVEHKQVIDAFMKNKNAILLLEKLRYNV